MGGERGQAGVSDQHTLVQVQARQGEAALGQGLHIVERVYLLLSICCFITWKPASVRWWRPAHSRVTRSLQWLAREMRAWSVRATQLEMQRYLEQADITL